MSRQFPVVNVASDTWSNFISRFNQIINLVNTDVVTVSSNTTGDLTSGNGFVIGKFGANTLVANSIAGGSVSVPNTLAVISNTNFTGGQVNSSANVYLSSANIYFNTANSIVFDGNTYFYSSNGTSVMSQWLSNDSVTSHTINVNSTTISGNVILNNALSVNGAASFANSVGIQGTTTVSNTLNVVSNGTFQNALSVGAALTVTGSAQLLSTLTVSALTTLNSNVNVSGAAALANQMTVIGNVALSNTLLVTGATTLSNTLNVTGNSVFNIANATLLNAPTGNITNLAVSHITTPVIFDNTASFSNTISVTGNATFGIANVTTLNASTANLINLIIPSTLTVNSNFTANSTVVIGPAFYVGIVSASSNGFTANTTYITIGNTSVNSQITPSTISSNSATFYTVNVTGTLLGTFNPSGNFIPTTNNIVVIGSSGNVFASMYSTNTYTNTIISQSGTLTINANTSINGNVSINTTHYMTTGTSSFSGVSQVAIDTFPIATYRSAEYTLQFADSSSTSYHMTKVLAYHDNTTAYSAEYAQMYNNSSLATIVVDVTAGNLRLLVTPATSTTTVKFTRSLITI
jgi:hypothetical protein